MAVRSRSGRFVHGGVVALLVGFTVAGRVDAAEITIAVAANFRSTLEALGTTFEAATGHDVLIASGSTGQLYAQIRNGAPYDIFLAADQERPRLLVDQGLGRAESVFTYAVGHLALWSRDPDRVDDTTLERLAGIEFRFFSIAEPDVAPYGAAAREVLMNLGVWDALQPRIVKGQNVAQAFAHLTTRNAELGLIALSQALEFKGEASYRPVPDRLHSPVRQDAVLLGRSQAPDAAREFLDYLRSPPALAIIRGHGFEAGRRP
jgi:molybdate transport system substrate-binding protein